MIDTKAIHIEKTSLLVWLILNLAIGALTVQDYGVSVDEPNNYEYASDTIDAYPSLFGILYEPKYNLSYDGHGPAFVTIAIVPIRVIKRIFPDIFTPDLWHFSYFIAFQLTSLCLYWITKRWFSTWTAWGILILFGTQPLLFGHAFINPKDIPFMFLVTLSVLLGFRLVDSMGTNEPFVSLERPVTTLTKKFQEADPQRRRRFLISLALALAAALTLFTFSRQIDSLVEQVVTFFYTASPDSWAGRVFNTIAGQASSTSAENYVTKAVRLFHRVELLISVLGSLFFLVFFGLLISNSTLPIFLRTIWDRRQRFSNSFSSLAKSLQYSLHLDSLKIGFVETLRALRNPRLILAGVALGLAAGVRAIAPWAGVIVCLYLFTKIHSKAWTTALAYFLVAGIVTYIAWPRLWGAPILRYLEGLGVISNFQNYGGRVLFNGRLYNPGGLPLSYLPVLLTIQFTEPLIIAIYIGLGILIWRLIRNRLRTDLLLYFSLGFAFSLFAVILINIRLYNNFRHVLFVIPAMFMLAAFTLELIFSKMTRSWARVLLIAAIALPGVYSTIKLHPYEYVYYNSLVGGPRGASNRYELDYWRISLREMALELNEIVPYGAKIIVDRSSGLFENYARPDLIVDKVIGTDRSTIDEFDYAVQLARWDAWDIYPDAKIVVIIEREGAVLVTAKNLKDVSLK